MHVAFDLDGVLLDSESDLGWLERALEAAVRELDVEPTAGLRSRLYPPTVDRVRELADEVGVTPERLWAVRNAHYVRVKVAAIESGELAPFDDVDVLESLAADHRLHILSNSPQAVVEAFVATNGYGSLFDVRLGRGEALEDLHRLKPHPHLYDRLRERVSLDGTTTYVGDTETDRRFAERTGMHYVHLPRDGTGLGGLGALPALLER